MYYKSDGMTEGEEFIAHFLREERIKFRPEVKIDNLKGDDKAYRVADFYLPGYNVYLEFFGLWNVSEERRTQYKEKMTIYSKNNIPCIYIYPENLGILQYCFDYRMKKELIKHHLKKKLFRYRLRLLLLEKGSAFFYLFLSIFLLIFSDYKTSPETNTAWMVLWSCVLLYQVGRLIHGYVKYFIRY